MTTTNVDYQKIIDEGLTRRLGPRDACPACTSKHITPARYCSPEKPFAMGLFRRCHLGDKHIHQRCKRCGMKWVCSPAEFER
jgi:hypothetical protein